MLGGGALACPGIGNNSFTNSGAFSFGGNPLCAAVPAAAAAVAGGAAAAVWQQQGNDGTSVPIGDTTAAGKRTDARVQPGRHTPFGNSAPQLPNGEICQLVPPQGGHISGTPERLGSDESDAATLLRGPQRASSAGSTNHRRRDPSSRASDDVSCTISSEVIEEVKAIQDRETEELLHVIEDHVITSKEAGDRTVEGDGNASDGSEAAGGGTSDKTHRGARRPSHNRSRSDKDRDDKHGNGITKEGGGNEHTDDVISGRKSVRDAEGESDTDRDDSGGRDGRGHPQISRQADNNTAPLPQVSKQDAEAAGAVAVARRLAQRTEDEQSFPGN